MTHTEQAKNSEPDIPTNPTVEKQIVGYFVAAADHFDAEQGRLIPIIDDFTAQQQHLEKKWSQQSSLLHSINALAALDPEEQKELSASLAQIQRKSERVTMTLNQQREQNDRLSSWSNALRATVKSMSAEKGIQTCIPEDLDIRSTAGYPQDMPIEDIAASFVNAALDLISEDYEAAQERTTLYETQKEQCMQNINERQELLSKPRMGMTQEAITENIHSLNLLATQVLSMEETLRVSREQMALPGEQIESLKQLLAHIYAIKSETGGIPMPEDFSYDFVPKKPHMPLEDALQELGGYDTATLDSIAEMTGNLIIDTIHSTGASGRVHSQEKQMQEGPAQPEESKEPTTVAAAETTPIPPTLTGIDNWEGFLGQDYLSLHPQEQVHLGRVVETLLQANPDLIISPQLSFDDLTIALQCVIAAQINKAFERTDPDTFDDASRVLALIYRATTGNPFLGYEYFVNMAADIRSYQFINSLTDISRLFQDQALASYYLPQEVVETIPVHEAAGVEQSLSQQLKQLNLMDIPDRKKAIGLAWEFILEHAKNEEVFPQLDDLTAAMVTRLTGVKENQMDVLDQDGIIAPSGNKARALAHIRYSPFDCVKLVIWRYLLQGKQSRICRKYLGKLDELQGAATKIMLVPNNIIGSGR